MWFDDLPPDTSWTSLWSGYIRCGDCSGIRTFKNPCPACGANLPEAVEQIIILDDGREYSVPTAYMGAETRYEDYVYLQLLEREWKRMMRDSVSKDRMPFAEQVSTGASIVLLFWTYFETRIEQLLRDGLRHVPSRFLGRRAEAVFLCRCATDDILPNRIRLNLCFRPRFLGILRREWPPVKNSGATKRVYSWIATEY